MKSFFSSSNRSSSSFSSNRSTSSAAGAAAAGSSPPAARAAGACRLGFKFVEGLRRSAAEAIATARASGGPFRDADELARRARLRADELERLATLGALGSLGLERREALWQAALAARPKGELFEEKWGQAPFSGASGVELGRSVENGACPHFSCPLPEMTGYERTVADFAGTGLTVGVHPIAYCRPQLDRDGVLPAAALVRQARGTRARIAGAVIVRQRPGTANGALFLTLEDETGMAQAIVSPRLFQEHRTTIVGNPGLVIEGVVESRDGSFSLRAERFWPLPVLAETPSYDFR